MTARARIVIVTYNASAFVAAAIDSALAQSVACELVVVDNASTDGTAAFVRSAYPHLDVVANARNEGFASAVNTGVAHATGESPEFVALLNPDATARPDWIERATAWMEERRVDVASSVVSGAANPFFAGGRWLPFLGVARTLYAYAGEEAHWVSGCAMLVRRTVFEQLRGFDDGYFLYSEDVDFCLRARGAGARVGVFEPPLVAHPMPGTSTDAGGALRKACIVMHSKGRLARRFSRGLALPSAALFQLLVSPALNGASVRDYPALMRAFLEGFRATSPVRAGL